MFHSGSLVNRRVSQPAVRTMVDEGMKALTGESTAKDAWAKFFVPSDVVAIKVNPSGVPGTVTSIPLLREVIQALNSVGVPNRNIIVYDRNSNQLEVNGYHTLVPSGVRVVGLDQRWSVKGETRSGYDPNVFCEMDCFGERETRSYLASIVTTEATKIINLPCLKEHNASGVTGCLKNLAYGSFNNVARTHVDPEDLHRPGDPGDVHRRPAAIEVGAAHHGRHPRRLPRRSVRLEPGVPCGRRRRCSSAPIRSRSIESSSRSSSRSAGKSACRRCGTGIPKYLGTSGDMQKTAFKNPFYREPGHIKTASELGLGKWELKDIDRREICASGSSAASWPGPTRCELKRLN